MTGSILDRDLKPDNILLDEKGHAHLTDFNIAVHFTEKRPLTSVAGSMAYMAPEVLAKRGYFSTVDWWSLGVVAFELLFGKRPYRGKTNSSLTQAILKESIRLPENADELVSPEGLDCIRGLLQRDTRKRLGCKGMGGVEAFKQHPWFKDIDWEVLERKEAIPPFEPDSKKANFDATHELEELLLEDNPLKAKKRNPNLDVSQLSADYRLMEQSFTPYDFTRQPRKSWFVLQGTAMPASAGVAGSPDVGVHPGAIAIEDQPMSDASSRLGTTTLNGTSAEYGPRSSSALGMGGEGSSTREPPLPSPAPSVVPPMPGDGQSFEMQQQQHQPTAL